jgi:hypothetical protein
VLGSTVDDIDIFLSQLHNDIKYEHKKTERILQNSNGEMLFSAQVLLQNFGTIGIRFRVFISPNLL